MGIVIKTDGNLPFYKGSVRPSLIICPAIYLQAHNNRPLAGSESGKGAMRSRPDELLAGALPLQTGPPAISPVPHRAPAP